MSRGELRVYLGAAPGVGKTYRMLGEAQRRKERGAEVVIGYVETHGRPQTVAAAEGLEVIPRRDVSYRGTTLQEMDLDAILARRPQLVLVDELAHTNAPGSRNAKRWQDVEELLAAGISVVTTVNIQHLESINDVVEKITGVPQRETVPDAVVRQADQVELVDMTAEALRRRMAHGNIYRPEKVDAALANYFRVGNLTALRELALLWLADKVDDQLEHYRAQHDIDSVWETRERVVVALRGGPEGEVLIRRASRIAARSHGGDLLAVHVVRSDGLIDASPAALASQRLLVESLGGSYHQVVGQDISRALLEFARAENATQLVLGTSRHGRLASFVSGLSGPGIGSTVTNDSGDIDVHRVTHEDGSDSGLALPSLTGGLTVRRRLAGALAAVVLLPLLTLVLAATRGSLNLTSEFLLFLLAVVVTGLIGGLYPGFAAAVAASLLINFYFVPPLHTLAIATRNNVLALVVFIAVAVMVSTVVDLEARRTVQAARASAEAQTLAVLAGSVLRGEAALPALMERARETFGMRSVTLLERAGEPGAGGGQPPHVWTAVACAGPDPSSDPQDADMEVPAGENLTLALRGRVLPASDRRVLVAFASTAAAVLEQSRLAQEAALAKPIAEADRTRAALLAAVSHDLRSPLASARVAVGSLGSSDVAWNDSERAELLATADESLESLARLVDNLLDMSRLNAGAVSVFVTPVALHQLMPLVLDQLGPAGTRIRVEVPAALPRALADPALLERVVVNVLTNALRYSPPDAPPVVTGSTLEDRIELRIIDRGPGIAPQDRERVFAPFQRLGDRDTTTGVGLGLALSRGLTEAMHGSLLPEETPGGGLTMVLTLPAVRGTGQPRALDDVLDTASTLT